MLVQFTVSVPAHQHMNGRSSPSCLLNGREEVLPEYLSEKQLIQTRSFGQRKFQGPEGFWTHSERVRTHRQQVCVGWLVGWLGVFCQSRRRTGDKQVVSLL